MRIEDNRFIGVFGTPQTLRGINWFGFNNGQTCVDGLWNYDPLASDFVITAKRIRALGFNAIRFPFSFKDLKRTNPRSFVFDTGKLPSDDEIAASVTAPGDKPKKLPVIPNEPQRKGTECNAYLPHTSVLDRFVWCVQFLARAGFYVLIDNHLREDQTALENMDGWLAGWRELIRRLCADKITRSRLMVDILNEPDQFNVHWQTQVKGLPQLYLAAMDTIDAVAPLIYVVEGAGQGGIDCNWGDGFCTNADLIKKKGLADPRPFLDAVLKKPYRDRVALGPHVYGPAVTHNNNRATGDGLVARMRESFGDLLAKGYGGKRWPVLLGEFGSKLEDAQDGTAMRDIVAYLRGLPPGTANWFWWSWNCNSGDTGGIVGDDWKSIQWKKIELLRGAGL